MFQIKLMYKDDKDLVVPVEEERLGEFYGCLANRQLFWFEPEQSAFWTDFADIRYVQVFRKEQDGSVTQINDPKKVVDIQEEYKKEEEKGEDS